jgi:parallel beta-helix repeat protein
MVTGTCKESVIIPSEIVRITLNGQGKATIEPPGTRPGGPPIISIFIRGKEITVSGFTIIGGFDGVHLSGAAAGASAIIDSNSIRGPARFGIHLDNGSVAQIANNHIEGAGAAGIDIIEHSVARIGFLIPALPPLGPNVIRSAGAEGIAVTRGSTAWIIGNTIAENKDNGILISRNAQADILANTISGNGGDAITASYGAGINFASEGTPRREGPNNTDTQAKNAGVGLRCTVGGYVAGPLGTLAGAKGAKEIDSTCADSLSLP